MSTRRVRRCQWKYDETHYKWDTSCEGAIQFIEGGPTDNEYKFCPHCGLRIRVNVVHAQKGEEE
jgi:rRNA maturation endonuclease Nob1